MTSYREQTTGRMDQAIGKVESGAIGEDDSKKAGLTPPRTEDELLKYVKRCTATALKGNEAYYKLMQVCYDFYRGKQWPSSMPKNRANPVNNRILVGIESIIPQVLDGNPRFQVMAFSPDAVEAADMQHNHLKYQWRKLKMQGKAFMAQKYAQVFGTGIFKTFWDPFLENGLGDINVQIIDIMHFLIDPQACEIDGARYHGTRVPTPVSEIIRRYPQARGRLAGRVTKADGKSSTMTGDDRRDVSDHTVHAFTKGRTNRPQNQVNDDEQILDLVELWIVDDTRVPENPEAYVLLDEQMKTEMGHSLEYHFAEYGEVPPGGETIPLYPHGRVVTFAGDVLIFDRANPFDHGMSPFTPVRAYPMPNEFFGMGSAEPSIPVQKVINRKDAQMLESGNKLSGAKFLIDRQAGVDRRQLNDNPNGYIEKNAGGNVEILNPPSIPPHFVRSRDTSVDDLDGIIGSHDASRGRRPAGVTSATGLATLVESDQTRVRKFSEHMETALAEVAERVIALAQQFYTFERMFPILGADGTQKWVIYSPEMMQGQQFSLDIEAQSTMPRSRMARASEAIQMFQVGLIDRPAALTATDWEDRIAIHERMEAEEMLQEFMNAGLDPQTGQPMAPQEAPAEASA